jgi:hypothetical protein
MKYLIIFLFVASLCSIFTGYIFELEYSQKLIGFGVLGLFLLAFPLFAYYRWKDKDVRNYMLTKENIEKMRERKNKEK